MELKKAIIKMVKGINRPDVLEYIQQIISDIIAELNDLTS